MIDKKWMIYCKKAKRKVPVSTPGPGSTGIGLCSFCGKPIYNKKGEHND